MEINNLAVLLFNSSCFGIYLIIILSVFSSSSSLIALPQVKEIISGSVQVEGIRSNHLQITASDKAIINYDSFNIAEGQKVTFIQPKSSSAVLNRVQGGDTSSLMGHLNANGRVFLINPNGFIIGPSSYIHAGSFIASPLDIADDDFLSDRFQF